MVIGDCPFFHHAMQFQVPACTRISQIFRSPEKNQSSLNKINKSTVHPKKTQVSIFLNPKSIHLGGTTHPTPSFLWLLVMLPHQSPNSPHLRLRIPPPSSAPQRRQRGAVPRNLGFFLTKKRGQTEAEMIEMDGVIGFLCKTSRLQVLNRLGC